MKLHSAAAGFSAAGAPHSQALQLSPLPSLSLSFSVSKGGVGGSVAASLWPRRYPMLFKQAELWMAHQGKRNKVSMPTRLDLPIPNALFPALCRRLRVNSWHESQRWMLNRRQLGLRGSEDRGRRLGVGARRPVCYLPARLPSHPKQAWGPGFLVGHPVKVCWDLGLQRTRRGCQSLLRARTGAFLARPRGSLRQEPPGPGQFLPGSWR